jgi:hypothetical protein
MDALNSLFDLTNAVASVADIGYFNFAIALLLIFFVPWLYWIVFHRPFDLYRVSFKKNLRVNAVSYISY